MTQAKEQEHWNERYVFGDTPWDGEVPARELVNFIESQAVAPCRFLELGCGTGTDAVFLASRGFEVTAVDIAPLAIERARAKIERAGAAVEILQRNVLQFEPFEPPWPLIYDCGLYHCIRREHAEAYVEKLAALCQPGGTYLTLAGNADDPDDVPGPPRVTATQIASEMERHFELVELRRTYFDRSDAEHPAERRHLAWLVIARRRPTSKSSAS